MQYFLLGWTLSILASHRIRCLIYTTGFTKKYTRPPSRCYRRPVQRLSLSLPLLCSRYNTSVAAILRAGHSGALRLAPGRIHTRDVRAIKIDDKRTRRVSPVISSGGPLTIAETRATTATRRSS